MRMHDEDEELTIEKKLENLFNGRYKNITLAPDGEGVQSRGFIGFEGSRKVFIKVGKSVPGIIDPMANDIRVQSDIPIDEASRNGISPLIDYKPFNGTYVTVEPLFDGGKPLADWGRIEVKEDFEDFVRGLIHADTALVDEYRYFHMDLHPRNIMLRKREGNLEVRLTDLKSAKKVDDAKTQSITTERNRFGRCPFLDACFNDEAGKYTESSEIYQIATNAIYSVIGQAPVRYDFASKTAINTFTGESVLDENGKLDKDKHQAAIDEGKRRMPKKIRKAHGNWISEALTIDPEKRTKTLKRLDENFKTATSPGIIERVKRNLKTIAMAGAATLTAAGLSLIPISNHYEELHKQEIEQASKYRVVTDFNGSGLEFSNNLVELKTHISKAGTVYHEDEKMIRANPGEKLFTTITASKRPYPQERFEGVIGFEGQMYFEGHLFDDGALTKGFYVYPYEHDFTQHFGDQGFAGSWININVPENFKPGVYVLAVELLSPEAERQKRDKNLNKFEFSDPGKVLSRKRISVVVGEPENAVDFSYVRIHEWDSGFSLRDLNEEINSYSYRVARTENLEAVFEIPQENHYDYRKDDYGGLWLPKGSDTKQKNLYTTITDDCTGNIVYFTGIPIQRKYIGQPDKPIDKGLYWWNSGVPGREFAQELYDFRQSLESQRHDE